MTEPSGGPPNSARLVIVLDDDGAARDSLVFLLTSEGFDVRSYASAAELLNDVNLPAFHCLIVDYHMPEMDGLDVVETLREGKNGMRAILVTGHADDEIRDRATGLGVPIVTKPFRGTELVDAIHTA